MALEKLIHPKRDSAHHVSKYANVKAEEAANYALTDGITEMGEISPHTIIYQHGRPTEVIEVGKKS